MGKLIFLHAVLKLIIQLIRNSTRILMGVAWCGCKFIPHKSLPPRIFLLKSVSKTLPPGKDLLGISGQ